MNLFLATLFFISSINCFTCHAFDYKKWWEDWYASGRNSGFGSYGVLAEFKAAVINDFLSQHPVSSVVEFGCGDGANLKLMNYKYYLGFDVSRTSIATCSQAYKDDQYKSFMLYDPLYFSNKTLKVDLVVCLDVLYHVIDETEFKKVLDDIFSFGSRYVILYTTLDVIENTTNPEMLFRDMMPYLKKYQNYEMQIVKNPHRKLSCADFIILTRKDLLTR